MRWVSISSGNEKTGGLAPETKNRAAWARQRLNVHKYGRGERYGPYICCRNSNRRDELLRLSGSARAAVNGGWMNREGICES